MQQSGSGNPHNHGQCLGHWQCTCLEDRLFRMYVAFYVLLPGKVTISSTNALLALEIPVVMNDPSAKPTTSPIAPPFLRTNTPSYAPVELLAPHASPISSSQSTTTPALVAPASPSSSVAFLHAGPNFAFPNMDAESLAALHARSTPFGIWYWPGYRPNTALKSIYPGLKGGVIFRRWSDLEMAPGVYDWSKVDADMDSAIANGLMYAFALLTGPDSPEWLYEQGVPKVLTTYENWSFPYYFHPLYRESFDRVNIETVRHLTSLSSARATSLAEITLNDGSTGDPHCYKGTLLPGYEEYAISTDEWDDFRRENLQSLHDYLVPNGLGSLEFSFSHLSDATDAFAAALFPEARYFKNGMASHGYHIPENETTIIDVQRSQAFDGDPKFGGNRILWYGEMDREWLNGWFQRNPKESFWWSAIYALHMGLSRWYIRDDALRVVEHHFAFDFFDKHSEFVDSATSPYAFCALRDGLDASDRTRFPEAQYGSTNNKLARLQNILSDFAPYGAVVEDLDVTGVGAFAFRQRKGYVDVLYGGVRGNYHRFLYQIDPPAESIGWWHVGSSKWPYGRFARSFHFESGRAAMYFRLDGRLISDKISARAIAVSVTYYDGGNGTWQLLYNDSIGGLQTAVEVTCTGTDGWQKVQVQLSSAKLNGGLEKGADIILRYVSGDDTKFHMVELDLA